MKINRWIVTAVDTDADGQCDGKARVLTTCTNEDEAKNFITEDMREYVNNNITRRMTMDEDSMRVFDIDDGYGCEWNLEEVVIELADDKVDDAVRRRAYEEGYNAGFEDGKHSILEA